MIICLGEESEDDLSSLNGAEGCNNGDNEDTFELARPLSDYDYDYFIQKKSMPTRCSNAKL